MKNDNALSGKLEFEGRGVRMVEIDSKPWWALQDVARVLGVKNHKDFLNSPWCRKDGVDLIYLIDSIGRRQKTTVVNEGNLFAFVLRSDKPEALAFHHWVTGTVLPAVRRDGFYAATGLSEFERMLALFVPGHIRPYASAFPDEFFVQVCRLNGIVFDKETHRLPRYIGHRIRDVLYSRLPPGVLARLDEVNPTAGEKSRRSRRHHQALSEEALVILKERVRILVDLARVESNWPDFRARVNAMYPKPGRQLTLPGTLSLPADSTA